MLKSSLKALGMAGVLAVLPASVTPVAAEVWGNDPSHNKVRPAKNLPEELNEKNLLWRIDTGAKHQFPMPAIVGDKMLVGGDAEGNQHEPWDKAADHGASYVAYSLKDGSQVWRLIVPEGGYGPGTYGVCATPVVEGDRVYIMAMHEIFCLDLDGLADGNDGMTDELAIMTRSPFKLPEGAEMPTELPEWAADVIWHYSLKPFNISVQDATDSSAIVVGDQLWVSTANEIGSRAKAYDPEKDKPHMVVLNKHTGELIATDDMNVEIVFHGEWSSPSLVEHNGERVVVFPDGYGVLHGLGIPEPSADGTPVKIPEYWTLDLNLPEHRYMPDGREIVYTLDKRLDFKYPPNYYKDPTKYYMFNDDAEDQTPAVDDDHWSGFTRANKTKADGSHPTVTGPCEIISMPAVHENRVYIGLGRDGAYGLSRNKGRFMCLEFDDVKQAPKILWEDREIGRTQSTASIHDGLVYIADGHGMLNCYEADTGEVVYRFEVDSKQIKERSQIVADGKIYLSDGKGMLKVLRAGREPFQLSENEIQSPTATVEAVDGLIGIVTHDEAMLFGDPAAVEARMKGQVDVAQKEAGD